MDEKLISQYLQDGKIAKDFATYCDLFHKYQSDYQIEEILSGTITDEIKKRAKKARFDEKIALLGLFLDKVSSEAKELSLTQKTLVKLLDILKGVKTGGVQVIDCYRNQLERSIQTGNQAKTLSDSKYQILCKLSSILLSYQQKLENGFEFSTLKEDFNGQVQRLQADAATISEHLSNLFCFYESVYSDGQEMLLLVTELTVNKYTAEFISQYGCEKYFEHNKELLFHERNKEIVEKLDALIL